jgi:2-methylisocitrate lyase-like PEP mutase family enzyme
MKPQQILVLDFKSSSCLLENCSNIGWLMQAFGPQVQVDIQTTLTAAGVRRISLATSLYRAAMTAFLEAANEVRDTGQFGFLDGCLTTAELNSLMRT